MSTLPTDEPVSRVNSSHVASDPEWAKGAASPDRVRSSERM
jgi:hypothetical protein